MIMIKIKHVVAIKKTIKQLVIIVIKNVLEEMIIIMKE